LTVHGADLAAVREIVARSIGANHDLQRLDRKRPWTTGRIVRHLVAGVLLLTISFFRAWNRHERGATLLEC
jgi:hypothetical protein